jgi:hypothetical protein
MSFWPSPCFFLVGFTFLLPLAFTGWSMCVVIESAFGWSDALLDLQSYTLAMFIQRQWIIFYIWSMVSLIAWHLILIPYFGPVWHSSQQLHELLWPFFYQTLIFKTTLWMKLFFSSSHKDMSWDESENSSLSHLSPSWVVGEAILPYTFSKIAQLY